MIAITFNAFSFLRVKLKSLNVDHINAGLTIPEGTTAGGLVTRLGLEPEEVEAIFLNGKVVPKDTVLHDNDRVAFVPPGTPGPHRALLGLVDLGEKRG